MVLKRLAGRPKSPLDAASADRAALRERARRTTFSLRYPPGEQGCYLRVWVQETVPGHGYRAAFLPDAIVDWDDSSGAQHLANVILGHMETLGLISESVRLRKTDLFALEVVQQLKSQFRMTALHVLLWLRRDLPGFELIRETAAAAE